MAVYTDEIQKLYVAYFNRPADYEGLAHWERVLTANGGNINAVSAFFAQSPEYKDQNAGKSYYQIVNQIYLNLFNREADVPGLEHWSGLLRNGTFTVDKIVKIIADNASNTDAQDRTTYLNKVAAATAFTGELNTASEIIGYTGNAANGAAKIWLSTVAGTPESLAAAIAPAALAQTVANVSQTGLAQNGQNLVLTAGVDTGVAFVGGTGNDTFVANRDINAAAGAGADTLGALDVIDGGTGTDTLLVTSDNGANPFTMGQATIRNIETIVVRGSDDVTANVSGANVTGLNSVEVTRSVDATVTAGTATNISVSGASGDIIANGGKDIAIVDATTGTDITVGTTGAYAAGNITVTDTKQDGGAIAIDGGAAVTVTSTSAVDSGNIVIGANKQSSGAVTVTQNSNSDGTDDLDAGDISVTGGSTVTVTANLNVAAVDENASDAHALGAITVTGDGKTSAVTITQNFNPTEFTKADTAVVKELHTVTFKALAINETTTVDGLTFTASKALTAAEVAQAFSNLTASDKQSAGGKLANGYFTGNLSANFTSGAANGAVVVFTAKDDAETLSLSAGAIDPTEVVTAGSPAVTGGESENTVTMGAVVVNGAATADAIKTVTINGYASADLGVSGDNLNALTALSLANSEGAANLASSAAALNLTVNNVQHAVNLDAAGAGTVKTLNITATGASSTFGLTAAAAEAITISGDKTVNIATGSTLSAVKTMTVTGSAGATFDATGSTTLTAVTTTGTTGTVTGKIDASVATWTGGAGVDDVTLTSVNVSKAISTGAGNDIVRLATGAQNLTAEINAGDGVDTLEMAAANAETVSQSNVFETKITGFEKLSLRALAANATVDLANIDDINYVIRAGNTTGASTKESQTIVIGAVTGTANAAADTVSVTIGAVTVTTGVVDITDKDAVIDALAAAINAKAELAGVVTAVSNHVDTLTLNYLTDGDKAAATFAGNVDGGAGTVAAVVNDNATPYAAGTLTAAALTLTNMANNGTLELTGAATTTTVTMTDATGTADVLNVVTKVSSAGINFGTVVANGVETVNITATDTATTTIQAATLALSSDATTTVKVTGNSDLALNLSAATGVTLVDASTGFTGKLNVTATGTAAATILGGSAADTLVASGSGDILRGGAGNDILTGADRTTLDGGAGSDTFFFNVPTNVNSYSTITNVNAGDVIDLDLGNAGSVVFLKAAIALEGTAVFQDLANAAVNAMVTGGVGDTNDAAWFQYNGDTYIVKSGVAHTGGNVDFQNGLDSIVKIVGLVDLSTASYNQSFGTLELV